MAKKSMELISKNIKTQGVIFILDDSGDVIRLELVEESFDLENLSEEEKVATKDYLEEFLSSYPIETCSVLTLKDIQKVSKIIGYPELVSKYMYPGS